MKCYLDRSKNFNITAYIVFLEEVFNTPFNYMGKINTFVVYESKIHKYNSFLLIRGENGNVEFLLYTLLILQKNIIMITCTAQLIVTKTKKINPLLTKNKIIYYPVMENESPYINQYEGKQFGLEFNPCKSEYKLGRYANKLSPIECLNKCFIHKKIRDFSHG